MQTPPEIVTNIFLRPSSPDSYQDGARSFKGKIFRGDILNSKDIATAIVDCDAVVSLIGHKKNSPPDLQTQFMRKLIPIMKEVGIKRLISLTGAGVPDMKNDQRSGFWHFVNETTTQLISWIDPSRIKDCLDHAEVIMQSDLDWTIVRTPLQVGARGTNFYWVGNVGKTRGWYVKREDIAHFIIKILKENSF